MPFDGSDFKIPRRDRPDGSARCITSGLRRWLRARFCWTCGDVVPLDMAQWSPQRRGEVTQLLQEAKGLISDPSHWVQRSYGWAGRRRCAVGALRSAASRYDDISLGWSAHQVLVQIASTRGFSTVEAMNDRSSHAEVMRAFDDASTLARGIA
jgi:hypothetical protein